MTEPLPRTPSPEDPQTLGHRGEAAAARYLQRHGYRILARRLATRLGEVDLLARKRDTLVAVEVKTRRSHQAPEWTLQTRQLGRLQRTLLRLATTERPRPRVLRVDVVAVTASVADTELADTELSVLHLKGPEFPPDSNRADFR